jgi:hypothetical protein
MLMQLNRPTQTSNSVYFSDDEPVRKTINLYAESDNDEETINSEMSILEAMTILDELLPQRLNDIHTFVFQQSWCGKSYAEMADVSSYNESYIKSVGASIWKLLSDVMNQAVTKSNIRGALEAYARRYFLSDEDNVWI